MAVATFGNNIVGAFTGGVTVNAIYAGSTKVWPISGPGPGPEPGDYYLEWWPKDARGSFIMGGESRRMEDYSGYYSGPFISVSVVEDGETVNYTAIDNYAFRSKSITSVSTNIPYIGSKTFMSCSSLSSVSLPFCKYISSEAFRECYPGLSYISLPCCVSISNGAFYYCNALRSLSLPVCETIEDGAFVHCQNLKEISLPVCKSINYNTFNKCYTLSLASLPVCEYVGSYAFAYCSALEGISLPLCSYIDNSAFTACFSLSSVSLPVCEYIGMQAFEGCSSLRSVILPVCSYIGFQCFWGCNHITLTLMNSFLVSFHSKDIGERGTHIQSIYVPSTLLIEYINTYSTYSNYFFPIPS